MTRDWEEKPARQLGRMLRAASFKGVRVYVTIRGTAYRGDIGSIRASSNLITRQLNVTVPAGVDPLYVRAMVCHKFDHIEQGEWSPADISAAANCEYDAWKRGVCAGGNESDD